MPIIDSTSNLHFVPKPKNNRFKDIEGQRFGRLVVIGYAGAPDHFARWYCKCDCGSIMLIKAAPLMSGNTKSCGCLCKEFKSNLRHGKCGSVEYRAYIAAKGRCDCPTSTYYQNYGGRGIEFRFKNFQEFYEEVGDKPSPEHSLDRIDVNGHYEKGNIRWAIDAVQKRNRTDNIFLTYKGETLCQKDWAKRLGISDRTMCLRRARGWCVECTLTLPLK